MGFDQLMTWYNHFKVRRSRIVLTCKNGGATCPTACVRVDADVSPLTVVDRIVELGGCAYQTLEANTAFGANKTLSLEADIARLQGVSQKTITADPSLRGSASASPTENSYYHIQLWDTAGVTGSCHFDVLIEYTATFYEPKNMVESIKSGTSTEFKACPKPSHQTAPVNTDSWDLPTLAESKTAVTDSFLNSVRDRVESLALVGPAPQKPVVIFVREPAYPIPKQSI